MGNVLTATPNEAIVVSGCRGTRLVTGGCTLKLALLEKHDVLPLELLTVDVESVEVESVDGVPMSLTSVAQVKVRAHRYADDGRELPDVDQDALKIAAQSFLGKPPEQIKAALRRTLEGHQRHAIGTLRPEQIAQAQSDFAAEVKRLSAPDVEAMGCVLVSLCVSVLSDGAGRIRQMTSPPASPDEVRLERQAIGADGGEFSDAAVE